MSSKKHHRESADAFRREYEAANTDDERRLILRLAREQGRVYKMENSRFDMNRFLDAVTVNTIMSDEL